MAAGGFNHSWARGLSHFWFQARRPRRREENHSGRHHQGVDATTRQGHTAERRNKLQKQVGTNGIHRVEAILWRFAIHRTMP